MGRPDGIPVNPFIKQKGTSAGNDSGSSLSISPFTNFVYSTESQSNFSAISYKYPPIYLSAEACTPISELPKLPCVSNSFNLLPLSPILTITGPIEVGCG